MDSWKLLNTLNYKQLFSLFLIFIKQPLYIYPALKATSNSMLIAQKEFPNIHGKNNKANAFRHALWNILLVLEMLKWCKNSEKAILFAEKITTWHEDFSPNNPLETAMDLHNNQVGIQIITSLLKQSKTLTSSEAIKWVHQKLKTSIIVFNTDDFEKNTNELVYLEDVNYI